MSEYTSAYDSAENAEGAVSKLKLNGYSEDSITLSAPRSQNGSAFEPPSAWVQWPFIFLNSLNQ